MAIVVAVVDRECVGCGEDREYGNERLGIMGLVGGRERKR